MKMMNNNHNWWCLCAVLLLMAVGTAGAQSVKRPQLDQHHLLLDANLDQNENAAYCFRTFQEAVNHLGDSCILYVAPGVYWVDNPDDPEIKVGKDGREPFGCVVKCRQLRIVGLDTLAQNTVLAAQRGQTQGAVGNFTMLDIWSDSLVVENLTLGNYCNVDLDYPLNPALSRKKRSDAITQAHVGYVHGKWLMAISLPTQPNIRGRSIPINPCGSTARDSTVLWVRDCCRLSVAPD